MTVEEEKELIDLLSEMFEFVMNMKLVTGYKREGHDFDLAYVARVLNKHKKTERGKI